LLKCEHGKGLQSWKDQGRSKGMMADYIPPQLVEVALSRIGGNAFETFSNEMIRVSSARLSFRLVATKTGVPMAF